MYIVHTEVSGLINSNKSGIASVPRTRSRGIAPSPAMFPSAHTACSATLGDADLSNATNFGIAPCLTTTRVCSDVPDATFVKAHAASNCNAVLQKYLI